MNKILQMSFAIVYNMIANLCFEFGHHPLEWPGNIKKIDKKSNTDHERRTK